MILHPCGRVCNVGHIAGCFGSLCYCLPRGYAVRCPPASPLGGSGITPEKDPAVGTVRVPARHRYHGICRACRVHVAIRQFGMDGQCPLHRRTFHTAVSRHDVARQGDTHGRGCTRVVQPGAQHHQGVIRLFRYSAPQLSPAQL